MSKFFKIILIALLSTTIASARVIQYNHTLEFSKYEVNEKSGNEENNLLVNIYSINTMESRFKALAEELGREQQQLFENNQKSSENLKQQLNDGYRNFNENIKNIIAAINKSLSDFEKIKNESKTKESQLRDEYIRENLMLDGKIRNYELHHKVEVNPLNDQKKLLTSLLIKCTQCDERRIENLKKELVAVERSLKMKQNNFDDETRPIKNKLDELMKNFTMELVYFLINDRKNYIALLDEIKQTQQLQKLLLNFSNVFEKYSHEKSQMDSNFHKEFLNLNKNLQFDYLKPTEQELIYETDNSEMKSQNFLEIFLKTTREHHQYSGNLLMSKASFVDEPSYLKWEKIHEKTLFIPDNAVISGYDVDGSTMYVVRAENNGTYTYGKYAHSEYRRNAYIPYEDLEKGVKEIELLTTTTHKWCKYDENKNYENLPVCRALYNGLNIPGTLQPDRFCRIGYAWKVYRIKDNIEVLTTEC